VNDPLQKNYEDLAIAIIKKAVEDSTKTSHSPEKHSADKFLKPNEWCEFLLDYFNLDVGYFRRMLIAERKAKSEKRDTRAKYRY